MEKLRTEPSKYTPLIDFDPTKNELNIIGESYPENTAEFYGPVFEWLDNYLEGVTDEKVVVNIELLYFNSSSSKVLMDLFDRLDEAAGDGKNVVINWIYEEDDDDTLEMGEEFEEDLESVDFNLVPKEA